MRIKFKNIYINYKILGSKGDWIVFLHGWGGNISSFEIVAKQFEKSNRCLLIDFPPFGNSEEPYEIWTLNDYVDLTYKIIKELKINIYQIIAHSFGGRVAIKLASIYNNDIQKLILVDSAGIKPRFNLKKFVTVKKYKLYKKMGLNTDNFGSVDYKSLSPLMKKTFCNILNQDLKPCLKSITCSTLIVFGKNDKDTPLYMAKKLNKKIKNSALIVFENCGHFSYLDDFNKFILVAKSFLRG